MNQKLIAELARLADFSVKDEDGCNKIMSGSESLTFRLPYFAHLIAMECAKIAENTKEYGALDNGGETLAICASVAIEEAFRM